MYKKTLLLPLFILLGGTLFAQQSDNSINAQFTELLKASNNYQNFKVVKKSSLIQLQNNTDKKIKSLNNEISSSQATIQQQQNEVNDLKKELASIQSQLKNVTQEKDDISFLGVATQKGAYKAIMWGLVFILLLILLFFISQYKKSNRVTKEARTKLKETENEFDEYRKNALEKQQRLGRMLQDEKNKLLK